MSPISACFLHHEEAFHVRCIFVVIRTECNQGATHKVLSHRDYDPRSQRGQRDVYIYILFWVDKICAIQKSVETQKFGIAPR